MEKEVVIYDKLVNKDIKVLYKHLFNKTLYIELQGALRECYIKKVVLNIMVITYIVALF